MTRPIRIIVLMFSVCALFAGSVNMAFAENRQHRAPCDSGTLEHKIRCLAKEIPHQGSIGYILGIARCEGAIDRSRSGYIGAWSLLRSEARVFPTQGGPRWDRLVRGLGLANGWRQTVGVLAHSQKYGWSWSSCS